MLKSFAGGRLFGGEWGTRPARVLALHGWQRTHADFSPVFAAAGSELSGVAPDLHGFGATPPPPEAWGSPDYAVAVATLFDEPALLAERVVLLGHSFGGRVALHLAQLVPDRVERLVLSGVPLLDRAGRRRVALPYRIGRRLHRWGLVGEQRMDGLRQRYGSEDYRAATGVMREVFVRVVNERYGEAMAALRCPADLVWGAQDSTAPLEMARRAVGVFPTATLTVLPGVGHLTPTEAPAALAEALLAPASARGTGADVSPAGDRG